MTRAGVETRGEASAEGAAAVAELLGVVAHLRGPEGCVWDQAQSHASLRTAVIEEAYELSEAIEAGAPEGVCEELGDLLLLIAFHGAIAADGGQFDLAQAARGAAAKLRRRHPHVFGEAGSEHVERRQSWQAQKRAEGRTVLGGVPRSLPALARAQTISARAARVGFDWASAADVLPKLHEEVAELEAAMAEAAGDEHVAEEIGDLLFTVVNLARKLGIDAEQALGRTQRKFEQRFGYVEARLAAQGRAVEEAGMVELDALWDEAKRSASARSLRNDAGPGDPLPR